MKHVPVPLTRVSGQRKPKCQMNDRAGARGRKTKPPPAVRYLRREGRARAAYSPGARHPLLPTAGGDGAAGRQGAPAVARTRGPGALRPARARRGESRRPGAPPRVACSSRLRRPLPRDRGTLRGSLRPGDSEAATRDAAQSRARPARPSAALPAAFRSGLGLGSPLCWHPPSLPTTPGAPRAAPRRRRPPPGYAAPPARPADSVESAAAAAAAAAAGTREAISPARAREGARGLGVRSGFTGELGGPGAARPRAAPQRLAPRRSLSRRRPRAARRPACVALSRRSPRARPASLALPPSSGPACPVPALALGGRRVRAAHLPRRRRPSRWTLGRHLPAPPCGALGWGLPARQGPEWGRREG